MNGKNLSHMVYIACFAVVLLAVGVLCYYCVHGYVFSSKAALLGKSGSGFVDDCTLELDPDVRGYFASYAFEVDNDAMGDVLIVENCEFYECPIDYIPFFSMRYRAILPHRHTIFFEKQVALRR